MTTCGNEKEMIYIKRKKAFIQEKKMDKALRMKLQ